MAHHDRAKFKKAIAQIIAAAWEDPAFMDSLLNAGDNSQMHAALQTKSIKLPAMPDTEDNTVIKFVANTDNVRYMVIPLKPKYTDVDIGVLGLIRQQQIFECCCDRASVDFIKEMVGEAAEAERQD